MTTTVTAEIRKADRYDPVAMVTRREWRVTLSSGPRKITATRREAVQWCLERGIPFEVV